MPRVRWDRGVLWSIPASRLPCLGGLRRGAAEAPMTFAACLPANPKSPCLTPSRCGAHASPTRLGFGPAGATSCPGQIRDGESHRHRVGDGFGVEVGRCWGPLPSSPHPRAGRRDAVGALPASPHRLRGWHPAHAGTSLSHPTGLVGHTPRPHRLTHSSRPLGSRRRRLRSNFAPS